MLEVWMSCAMAANWSKRRAQRSGPHTISAPIQGATGPYAPPPDCVGGLIYRRAHSGVQAGFREAGFREAEVGRAGAGKQLMGCARI